MIATMEAERELLPIYSYVWQCVPLPSVWRLGHRGTERNTSEHIGTHALTPTQERELFLTISIEREELNPLC